MPNRGYTHKTTAKLINDSINDFFNFCYDGLGYEYMSEVLEIDKTDNINLLYKEFVRGVSQSLLVKAFHQKVLEVLEAHQ